MRWYFLTALNLKRPLMFKNDSVFHEVFLSRWISHHKCPSSTLGGFNSSIATLSEKDIKLTMFYFSSVFHYKPDSIPSIGSRCVVEDAVRLLLNGFFRSSCFGKFVHCPLLWTFITQLSSVIPLSASRILTIVTMLLFRFYTLKWLMCVLK